MASKKEQNKEKKESEYRLLHEARLQLLFGGMLPDKENEKIKIRIDKWAKRNGLVSFPERNQKFYNSFKTQP